MTSKSPVRSCEDIDETALSYAEVKALATGNPYIKEKMDLEVEVARLKLIKSNHDNQRYAMEDALLKQFPMQIKQTEERIESYKKDIARVVKNTQENKTNFLPMTILGKEYSEKADAGGALIDACKAMTSPDPKEIGSYRGFGLELTFDSFSKQFKATLKGAISHVVELGSDIHGNITRLDNALEGLEIKLKINEQSLIDLHQQVENAKGTVEKPFAQAEELRAKLARLSELSSLLSLDKREPEVFDVLPDETETTIFKNEPER